MSSRRKIPQPTIGASSLALLAGLLLPGVAVAATAAPTTLEALLAYAEHHAPQLKIADATVARARANVAAARPGVPSNPVLSAAVGPRLGGGDLGLDFQLGFAQDIAIGGQIKQRRRAAAATVDVAKAARKGVHWQLHVQLHQLFFVTLVALERERQAELLLKFSTSLRNMVRKQARVGQRAPMAVLVVDTDVARAKENLVLAQLAKEVALARAQTLIGWRGSPLTHFIGTLPPTTSTFDTKQLRAWMLSSHPNIKRRQTSVRAAQLRVVLADRMAMPNLTLGVNYARESQLGPQGPGGSPAQHVMLATVAIPLMVSQKNQGPRARSRANVLIAKAQLETEKTRLWGKLRVELLSLRTAQKRVQLYAKGIIPALARNLKLLLKAFAVGEVNLTTISLTRQRLLQATQRYIDARRRYFLAGARVEGVVGRDIFDAERKKP